MSAKAPPPDACSGSFDSMRSYRNPRFNVNRPASDQLSCAYADGVVLDEEGIGGRAQDDDLSRHAAGDVEAMVADLAQEIVEVRVRVLPAELEIVTPERVRHHPRDRAVPVEILAGRVAAAVAGVPRADAGHQVTDGDGREGMIELVQAEVVPAEVRFCDHAIAQQAVPATLYRVAAWLAQHRRVGTGRERRREAEEEVVDLLRPVVRQTRDPVARAHLQRVLPEDTRPTSSVMSSGKPST